MSNVNDMNNIDINNEVWVGLKKRLKLYKGCSIRYKVESLIRELKYAWQRAWCGYDDLEIWNMDSSIRNKLIVWLRAYKENRHCLWWCPDGYDWSQVCEKDKWVERYNFSPEQMDIIIDTFIFHLLMSDEDYVEKKLYGNNAWDDDYVVMDKKRDYKRIFNVRKQNQDAAIKLLGLLMDELWD